MWEVLERPRESCGPYEDIVSTLHGLIVKTQKRTLMIVFFWEIFETH